jgi:hypothetical protein
VQKPHTYLVDSDTGRISNEIMQGDSIKIIRKETKDFLNNTVLFKDKAQFVKIYEDVLEYLMEADLTKAEMKIIFCCLRHLDYCTGAVVKDKNNSLSGRDIEVATKLPHITVVRSLNNLIDANIICKNKASKGLQLFLNPHIFMKGNRINETLLYMFKKP